MALITINGVNMDLKIADDSPLTVMKPLNGRAVATFSLVKNTLVTRFHEVQIYAADGVTAVFGGLVWSRRVRGATRAHNSFFVEVTCTDFLALADYAYATLTYAVTVNVEDVIDDLVDVLSIYGITYTPAATGQTFEPFSWVRKKVGEALREISERTGLVFRLTPAKVLVVETEGYTSAPWVMTDVAMHCDEVIWDDPADLPITDVTLVCGVGTEPTSETFVTDGLSHGGFTTFTTKYPAVLSKNSLWPNVLYFNGVNQGPISWAGELPAAAWRWYAATHSLVLQESIGGIPAAGISIAVAYDKQMPFDVEATTGGSPSVRAIVVREDITEIERGESVAEGLLARKNTAGRTLSITGFEGDGFEPNQSLTVDITKRGTVDTTALVTGVTMTLLRQHRSYVIDAIEGGLFAGSQLDEWREMFRGGSSGSGLVSSGGGGGGGSTVTLMAPTFLGGARGTSISPTSGTYVPVVNFIPFVAAASFAGLVRVWLWAAEGSVGVTARLWNETDSTSEASSEITATVPTMTTFFVTIEAGKEYWLEITSDNSGKRIYGLGTLASV